MLKCMLTNLEHIDLKLLSEVYDADNQDSFISIYLDAQSIDPKFIERRISAVRPILKSNKGLLSNFDKTMATVQDYIQKSGRVKGQKGLVIYASEKNKFFRAYRLALPVENMLIADTSPYIRPLAMLVDDYETFGLLVLDQQQMRIFIVSSGKVDFSKKKAKDIMNKHKKGGWSQARFQRLRKGAIDKFMKEVAEDVEKIFSQDHVAKIVIAGPGNAKVQFQEYLSLQIREKIVDLIEIEFDEAEGTLVSRAVERVIQDEREKDAEHVSRLRQEILRNGLAVYGVQDTKVAVQNGQVELLMVSKNFKVRGWTCEHCQFTDVGDADECPYCGGEANEVDVVEEIVETAISSDTSIDFVDSHPDLDQLGGVGGLLRYK